MTKTVGRSVLVLQLSVKGISTPTCDYIEKIVRGHYRPLMLPRDTVYSYKLIFYILLPVQISADYLKNDLENYAAEPVDAITGTEAIKVELGGISILSVHKPRGLESEFKSFFTCLTLLYT